MTLAELTLPWPSAKLSPNARVHWAVRNRAAQEANETAYYAALEAGWRRLQLPAEGRIHLLVEFYPARACSIPDDDNMLGRFKHYRDGLAEALGINDRRFQSHPVVHTEVRKGGEVRVRLRLDAPHGEAPATLELCLSRSSCGAWRWSLRHCGDLLTASEAYATPAACGLALATDGVHALGEAELALAHLGEL